jgi:hypothetical protein
MLANRQLGQIDPALRAALLDNAGTLVTFRLSADDAIEPQFNPELAPYDLAHLGRHEIAIRLAVDGISSLPFTATVTRTA